MADLPRRYRYRYEMIYRFGSTVHTYELIGRHVALTFHVTDMGEDARHERYSAGLETHHRQPPDYMRDDPPSFDRCYVINAPCWHDGTSLHAHEQLLPIFETGNHETIFRRLVLEADEASAQFQPAEAEAAKGDV